ncbi:MAG: RHS repeat-associated core domain-containing protein [Anaerolineales bacterium]
METTVDTKNNTLTALSDHLTVFDYKANNWQSQMVPTVDAFKVADFTGAGTYQVNLWTPPGPGGLQPSLTLSYNSQIIDESSAFSQSSWVGMGWTLDTGSVTRNMHGTDSDNGQMDDDTFIISVGGISGQLLPVSRDASGEVTTYNTADQSFTKVIGDNISYKFTAWTKDGTKYEFAHHTDTDLSLGCSTTATPTTWRWSLTSVTDVHGNTITYTYNNETKRTPDCENEVAVYPATITYGNGYTIVFNKGSRNDYQNSWTYDNSHTLYGTQRLNRIKVQQNNVTIRRYDFSYASDTSTTNIIYPNFTWSRGTGVTARTLTLVGVQEFERDDLPNNPSPALPAVTFTYGDQMHLTQVNNGQGGTVTMTYQKWSYYDDTNHDLRSLKSDFGIDECRFDGDTAWVKLGTTGTVRCDPGPGFPTGGLLQVGNSSSALSYAERPMPENLVKPGGRYNLWFNVFAISGTGTATVSWGMSYNSQKTMVTRSGITSTGGGVQEQLNLPATYNPSRTKFRIECRNCSFRDLEYQFMPEIYRVTQHTVTAEPTNVPSTSTYYYDNASPASIDNSAAANVAGGTLYTPILREFRGNAMTQSVNPEGLATVNWFWQSDDLKGRAYDTLVMKRDGEFYDFETVTNPARNPDCEVSNADWQSNPDNALSIGYLNQDVDFDCSASLYSSTTNYVSYARNTASLSSGEVAVAHVRLIGTNAQGEVGLVDGSGQFVGITLQSATATASNGTTLLSNFAKSEWYGVMFFADSTNGTRVRIWQLDNPSNFGETVITGTGSSWTFRERVKSGTIWLDSYFEGTPYAETITRYNSTIHYSVTAVNNLIYSSTVFQDLKIVWNSVASVEQRNYNGDARYVGTKQVFTYDTPANYGNLLTQQEYAGDNNAWTLYRGSKIQYAAPVNTTTAYLVGLPGRQVTLDCTSGTCDFTNETGKVSESISFYDNNTSYTAAPVKGLPTKQRVWVQSNNYSQVDIGYDTYGNPTTQTTYTGYATQTTDPSFGAQTTYTCYGGGGTLGGQACVNDGYHTYPLWVRNALGQTTQTTYNYALGLPDSVTDSNGVTTYAGYDAFGRMIKIAAPGDSLAVPTLSITYYDGTIPFQIDLTQRVSDTAVIRLSRFYDGAGRQIQTQTVGAVVDGIQSTVVVDSLYDSLGRLSKQSVPNPSAYDDTPGFVAQNFSQFTLTEYDILGRALTVTQPNGNLVQYSYGDLSTTVTDPKTNSTTTTADVWGRTTSVDAPTGPDVSYTYDVLGRLLSAARGGVTTSITYDSAGRKLNMTDPDMGYWTYDYDALGDLKVQKDARDQYICLYYDVLNRLVGKHYRADSSCPASPTYDVTYSYDNVTNGNIGIGRRTGMSDSSGSTSWVYDNRGRMTQENKLIGTKSFGTSWTYNSADLPVTMTYPDSEVLTYGYNSDGTLNTVTSSLGGSTYLGGMKYDEAGRIESMDYGAGIIRKTYTYFDWNEPDQGGLLNSAVTTRLSDQTAIQNFAYTYDKNANVQTINDALAGPQTQTFGYDSLNRLTSAQANGGTNGLYGESYEYNASGNLWKKNGIEYYYEHPTHAHAVTRLDNGNTYDYDTNGNMTSRHVNSQNYTLGYDAENRLVSVGTGSLGSVPASLQPDLVSFQDPQIQSGGRALNAPIPQPLQQSGFPSTAVLDNFNRADNSGLGSGWDGVVSGYDILSNKVDVKTGDNHIYWQGGSYSADQEVYVTLSTVDTISTASEQDLLLKSQNASDWGDGVLEVLYKASSQQVEVWTYDPTPGVQWQPQCTISVGFANGDQFGARARANGDVEVYKNGAKQGSTCNVSSWRFYNASGHIGLWFINASNAVLDDFGGGNISTSATNTPTATATATNTPVVTNTFTNTPTRTYTPTNTPVVTNTFTNTPTRTNTPTNTPIVTNTFTNTPTKTLTPSNTPTATATFTPTFTPTLTLPPTSTAPIFSNATFTYDGDGKRVKSVMTTNIATTTTYFVGAYYEVANGVVTKYYYAGSQRIAMRNNSDLKFLVGDHLGSTSLTTGANGTVVSELRYKAWGEVRSESGSTPTKYTYTGQYSYTSDFGLMFYNARWVDVSLGRFAQADTIVPDGIQGYDRYAYSSNNPVKYTDPTGHCAVDGDDWCFSSSNSTVPVSTIPPTSTPTATATPSPTSTQTPLPTPTGVPRPIDVAISYIQEFSIG